MLHAHVRALLTKEFHLSIGTGILVGASGGLDSTVLTHVMHRIGFAVEVLHVNYGLRGAESDKDEVFVRELCDTWKLPFSVEHLCARQHAQRLGISTLMAARTLRYEAFSKQAQRSGLNFIAVGHHADDQVETLLLNLGRGSGPEGLAGMPVKRPLGSVTLIRPLLHLSRSAIAAYAKNEQLSWREDASNENTKYRRAALRKRILPTLEEIMGQGTISNMAQSAHLMRDYVEATFHPILDQTFAEVAEERRLNLMVMRKLSPVWQRRIILEGLRRWLPGVPTSGVDSIAGLLSAQPGKRIEIGGNTVWRGRKALIFESGALRDDDAVHLLHEGEVVVIEGNRIDVSLLPVRPPDLQKQAPQVVYLDCDRLEFPLKVRRWRAGDRMRPLGMDGNKKVSDLLTDTKIRVDLRNKKHVVLSGEDIVWLVGVRIAASYRVRADTKHVVRLASKM